jgi:hypothetical protein
VPRFELPAHVIQVQLGHAHELIEALDLPHSLRVFFEDLCQNAELFVALRTDRQMLPD